jgi:cytochrome oxidase Cu insertion factor (SCO1/SenC/PrrC family)
MMGALVGWDTSTLTLTVIGSTMLESRISFFRRRGLALAMTAGVIAVAGVGLFALQATRTWEPLQPAATLHEPSDLVSLVDQADERFSLQQLRGRTVVLNFIFTHCQTSCPLQVQALVGVQRALRQGGGR